MERKCFMTIAVCDDRITREKITSLIKVQKPDVEVAILKNGESIWSVTNGKYHLLRNDFWEIVINSKYNKNKQSIGMFAMFCGGDMENMGVLLVRWLLRRYYVDS